MQSHCVTMGARFTGCRINLMISFLQPTLSSTALKFLLFCFPYPVGHCPIPFYFHKIVTIEEIHTRLQSLFL